MKYLAPFFVFSALLGSFLAGYQAVGTPPDPRLQREELYRRINTGIAYLEQFKPEEAARNFRQAVEKDPKFALGHVNLAIAYYFNRDVPKAVEEARLALSLAPNSAHAHYILGLAYKNDRRLDDAVAELNAVLALDPRDPAANIQLGQVYVLQQKFDEAVVAFRKALDAEPYNATAAYNLAQALQRGGKAAEGKEAFALFARLRASNYKTEIGNNYGDVGRYAEATAGTGAEAELVSTEIKLKYQDETRALGLTAEFAPSRLSQVLGRKVGAAEFEKLRPELVAAFSASVGVFDYDGDGRFDVLATGIGKDGQPSLRLFHNDGAKYSEVTASSKLKLAKPAVGAVFGDIDNDGRQDIVFFGYQYLCVFRNNGDGTFADVTEAWGMPVDNGGAWGLTAALVDCDHDGDLDLFIGNFADLSQFPAGVKEAVFPDDFPGTENRLLRNNGDNKGKVSFSDVTAPLGLGGGRNKTTAVVCTDFDNHRDVDFFVVNYGAPVQLFANQREGAFREVAAKVMDKVPAPKALSVAAGDFNKDGFTDFYLPDSQNGISLTSDGRGAFKLAAAGSTGGIAAIAADCDGDGLLDRAEFGPAGFSVSRNTGNAFTRIPAVNKPVESRAYVLADIRGVGGLDALMLGADGSLVAFGAEGAGPGYAAIRAKGLSSNRAAIGTKAILRSGSLIQKQELYATSPAIASAGLYFGLGYRSQVDSLQLLWPSGILQSELEIKAGSQNTFEELDRKGTSCPILYAWNGREYAFVTDFMGGCAIGMRESGNHWSTPDTDEYVRVTGEQLREKDGRLSILMNNQLEEVIFFDQVKLLAVDHPAGTEIYPNEKLLPGPPYTPYRIFEVRNARPPVAAVDDKGRDILEEVSKLDRRYPTGFRKLKFKGYAEEHHMVFNLGQEVLKAKHPLLLLSAWIDYADSTSNLAASQAGVEITPPYLQVRDARGQWQTVIPDMGFPAGLTKTITVDLTGKFLTRNPEVRIVTSMCIYWDQVLVDTSDLPGPARVTTLNPVAADLHWRGFPKELAIDSLGLKAYDYAHIDPSAPWKAHTGDYTRYGDVRELLLEKEDMYVITRNGDEMKVEFDARKLPSLPAGWKRDYLIYADGFGKDMDVNSGRPETVGELPYHGMKRYPYAPGDGYPVDPKHLEYLRKYNTRSIGVQTEARWRGVR